MVDGRRSTVRSFAEFSRKTPMPCGAGSMSSCRSCATSCRPRAGRSRCRPTNGALLERSAAGRRPLEVSALSPLEFVLQEFEHPTVQAGLLFFNGLREVDLRVRGFGTIAALLASPAKAQMSRGGSGAARALRPRCASGGAIA
jgi:hypothetical protein